MVNATVNARHEEQPIASGANALIRHGGKIGGALSAVGGAFMVAGGAIQEQVVTSLSKSPMTSLTLYIGGSHVTSNGCSYWATAGPQIGETSLYADCGGKIGDVILQSGTLTSQTINLGNIVIQLDPTKWTTGGALLVNYQTITQNILTLYPELTTFLIVGAVILGAGATVLALWYRAKKKLLRTQSSARKDQERNTAESTTHTT